MKTQESLQRSLCRATVLLCAVVPVLCLMAASVYWKLPWVRSAEAQAIADLISDSCGVIAKIDSVRHLSPRRLEIRNLTIYHPETSQTLIEVPLLNAQRYPSRWEINADTSQCAVDQLLKLSRMAHDRFLCRADERLASVRIIAKSTSLMERGQLLWKGNAQVDFTPARDKTTLKLCFFPEGNDQQSIAVQFDRYREQLERLQTSTQLVANKVGVPTRLLREIMPNVSYLGEEATFEGHAVWLCGERDSMAVEQAVISNIQMEYVTRQLAFQTTGLANIYFLNGEIRDGRIVKGTGIFDAIQGSIPNQWLEHAVAILGLQMRDPSVLKQGQAREYRQLRFGFSLSDQGVRIAGEINPMVKTLPMVVLSDASGHLMYEAASENGRDPRTYSIADVIRWICTTPFDSPGSGQVTPASYQAGPAPERTNQVQAYLTNTLPETNRVHR